MILHENTVNKKTVNKLVLAFDEDVEGKVVSVKAGNKVICKRNITGGRTKYNVVFQNTTSENKDIVVSIDTTIPKDKIVYCYDKEICGSDTPMSPSDDDRDFFRVSHQSNNSKSK